MRRKEYFGGALVPKKCLKFQDQKPVHETEYR